MTNYKNLVLGITVVTGLLSGTAYAGTITDPLLSGTVIISNGQTNIWQFPSSATYTTNPDGTYTYDSSLNNATWGFDWAITVDPDPLISATLGITNNTTITKHFDVLFTLPVGTAFGPSGFMSGSLGATFQDLNLSGDATLSNINWSGLIDGAAAMSLFGGDFTCGGAGCTGNIFPVSDGPLSSSGVNSSIGLQLSFDLSAGDRATFDTFFEVTPVPLPAALWLLGSGLLGVVAFARKKR